MAKAESQGGRGVEEIKGKMTYFHVHTKFIYLVFFCNISGDITSEENACSQEKQAKRKITRADEEKRLAQKKKEEEERRQREIGKRRSNSSFFKKKKTKI